MIWIWAAVWALTRALMVVQVGFWDDLHGVELQDVNSFEAWSDYLANERMMPTDEGWQYPPGAALVMLLPRLSGTDFGESFVAMMLIFDLIGLALLALLAKRGGRYAGVWVWLLAMPVLHAFPVLRFDLVPTVIGIAALVVIHRRPVVFGALAGIGATVKVWPIVVLLAEWDRRRLIRAVAAAVATVVLVFAIAAIAFGDQTGFLSSQSVRGLQLESVAATPWYVRETITGEAVPFIGRNGTLEVASPVADAFAQILEWLALAILAAGAAWWWARSRAINSGRTELMDATVSRDFVFTLVLLLVVTSRVLSPQFMIWLVGLSAVVLTAGQTRLARPAWIVIGAVVLSAGLYQDPSNFVIRNIALLVAAIDASITMALLVRPRPAERPVVESGRDSPELAAAAREDA